jgi:hypothetical protein
VPAQSKPDRSQEHTGSTDDSKDKTNKAITAHIVAYARAPYIKPAADGENN